MTVVVQCFHCNAILELDEGFRGGVCRCSTCGSLLQVPKGDAEIGKGGKRIRPAAPPASTGGAASQAAAAAKGDPGQSSGKFDPRAGMDLGGSSSGLGRIHKTRPISPTLPKKKPETIPPESRPANPTPPPAKPPAHGLPEIRAIKRNKTLFWSGILLILIIAAFVLTVVAMYIFRPETRLTPRLTPTTIHSE